MTLHELRPRQPAAADRVQAAPVGSATRPPTDQAPWVTVCAAGRIAPDTGVAALVGGQQVAVFRLADGSIHAIDNRDPASGANVLARGIVGDSGARPVVASPVYKQRFDLDTGACLDDPALRVRTWEVRLVDGVVGVRSQPADAPSGPSS